MPADTAASPGAQLTLYSHDGLTADFDVEDQLSVGRHFDNDVVVVDREVSKYHGIVERRGADFFFKDLGSSNGSFVNGRRVDELKLREGDEIKIGASRLIFRVKDEVKNVKVVQASFTQVLASAAAIAPEAEAGFQPASEIASVEQLKKDYERLRIAHRFHQEGGLVTDRKELFQAMLKLCFEWLPADGAVVLEPGADGALAVSVAENRTEGDELQVSSTLVEQVATTREGILCADAITDQRFSGSESIVARGVRSVLAVPIVVRDNVEAIVYLDSRSLASAFTPKDLDILTGIASQAAVSLLNAELIETIKKEEATRSQLERFLSPALVQQAATGDIDLKKGGSVVDVTIMFTDIRGFTSMSERYAAEDVVRLLNEHFEDMVDCVFNHEGVLDKFIGDAVMAIWGVPVAGPNDEVRALRAALDMQARLVTFNARRESEGKMPIGVGIGINTGECVVGNMGSSRRLEYTVIGDSVNVAARLCSLAKGGEIIVSQSTMEKTRDSIIFDELEPQPVKGKSKPVPIFRATGEVEDTNA